MSQQQCTRCPALESEIQRLQIEILRLQRTIEHAKAVCVTVASSAGEVLSTHQPRGVWSYAKGQLQAAQDIIRHLEV